MDEGLPISLAKARAVDALVFFGELPLQLVAVWGSLSVAGVSLGLREVEEVDRVDRTCGYLQKA